MATTDLSELIRARCAEKIANGKSPSKADLAWLDATAEHKQQSSVAIGRNSKFDMVHDTKIYHDDPEEALRVAEEIADHLNVKYPTAEGTARRVA